MSKYRAWLSQQLQNRTVQWILLITLVGFILRILGLDFGLPNDSRPDEIPILQVVLHHLLSPILKDGNWQLHPHFLNYPSLYFYIHTVIFGLYYCIGMLLGWFTDWRSFLGTQEMDPTVAHLILRWFSATTGAGVIIGTALLAQQWSQKKSVVILAATLAAANYLLVRNSHFGSVDMLMTLGVVLSLWAILRYRAQKTAAALNLACILCGLSIGTKYPAALLLLPIWVVLLESNISHGRIDWAGFLHSVWKPTGLVVLVFLLTSPWIVLDFPEFLQDFQYESHYFFDFKVPGLESGWLFYPDFALWYGVGGICFLFGFLGMWLRLRKAENRWADIALLSFLVSFYLLLGFNERVMTRYALPMVPVILLYAAWAADELAALVRQAFKSPKTSLALNAAIWGILGVLIIGQSLLLSTQFDQLLMQADTRNIAREWVLMNVPPKTPVATGPRLGMIVLPWDYGQLLVETGPQFLNPPQKFQIQQMNNHFLNANSYANLDALKKLGIRYVITYQGLPAYGNRPWEMNALTQRARLVFYVNPVKRNVAPEDVGRFDPLDAFYLPYDNLDAFERPGPIIALFDLNQPPAIPDKSRFPGQGP